MSSTGCTVRTAGPRDMPDINAIHKYYVQNTVLTFTLEPNSYEETLAEYHKIKTDGLPYLVAVDDIGRTVLGYTYVTSFRGNKPGYRHTLELSLFCHPDFVRLGIGDALLRRLLDILKNPEEFQLWFEGSRLLTSKPRQLIAIMAIDVDMPGKGLKLRDWYLERGFEQSAHLKEVGWKKQRWVDTLYLQLALSE